MCQCSGPTLPAEPDRLCDDGTGNVCPKYVPVGGDPAARELERPDNDPSADPRWPGESTPPVPQAAHGCPVAGLPLPGDGERDGECWAASV